VRCLSVSLSLLLSVLCCVVTSVSVVSFISNVKDTVAGLIGYRRAVEEAISARALHENQKQMLKDMEEAYAEREAEANRLVAEVKEAMEVALMDEGGASQQLVDEEEPEEPEERGLKRNWSLSAGLGETEDEMINSLGLDATEEAAERDDQQAAGMARTASKRVRLDEAAQWLMNM
jgi:hypothetical protein